MKIKICFNNETHRLTKVPETFQNLSELISSIFLSSLPTSWVLEYLDSEGDKIMLGDEQDYIEFMNSEVKTNLSGRAIKVFIVPKVPLTESQALERALALERRLEEQNETSQSIEISEKSALESKPLSIEEPIKPVEEVRMEMIKPEEPVPVQVREEPVEVQEVKVAEMEKVVIDEKPKVAPKNVAQKRGGKGKKQFTKTVVSQVKVGVQNLDDMVNKAVEKNIEKIAMMTQSFLSQSSMKAQVEEQTQTQAQIPQPVHDDVECNGCGMCPIVGMRYKCTVNPDFDFCERCEQSKEHPYAFIKIKFPGQVYSNEHLQQQQKMVEEIQPEEEIVEEKIAVVEEVKEEKTQEKPEPHEKSEVVVPTTKPEVKQSWFRWPRVQAPTYSRQVMNKAQQLKELLPEVNIDSLLSFVSNAPEDLDLVELLENFKY